MKKALDVLEKIIEYMMVVLVFAFTALIFVQVVSRYVFNNTVTWSEQAGRYLFIWLVFLGLPILYRHGEHVGFTMVVEKMPRKVQSVIGIVVDLLVMMFAFFLLVQSIRFCGKVANKTMIGLGLSQLYVHTCQPACAVLLIIFDSECIVNRVKGLFKKEETE